MLFALPSMRDQVADDEHRIHGYGHFFMTGDMWSQWGLSMKFYAWYGKWWQLLEECMIELKIDSAHMVRGSTYKGENSRATVWPNNKYDCCTALGIMVLLRALATNRTLPGPTQTAILNYIRGLVQAMELPRSLKILPAVELPVDTRAGMIDLSVLKDELQKEDFNYLKAK